MDKKINSDIRGDMNRKAKRVRKLVVGGVVVGADLASGRKSLLGQVVDISKKYMRDEDDDNDPTGSTPGSGGAGSLQGGSAEDVSEFVSHIGLLTLIGFITYATVWAVQNRTASDNQAFA